MDCAAAGNTGAAVDYARGLAINDGTLYIIDEGSSGSGGGALLACPVSADTGAVGECENNNVTPTLTENFNFPKSIAINGDYLYFIDAGSPNKIYQCPLVNLIPDGPSNCTITDATLNATGL